MCLRATGGDEGHEIQIVEEIQHAILIEIGADVIGCECRDKVELVKEIGDTILIEVKAALGR